MISILVINPNSSESMTEELRRTIGIDYADINDIHLEFETGPQSAPASIDGTADGILSASCYMSSPTAKAITEPESLRWNAIVVACYSPHPLVPMLREKLRIPIVGIFESSITTALHLGRTFGIVTTGKKWEGILADGIQAFGVDSSRCAGVIGTGLGVLELNAGEAGNHPTVAQTLFDASIQLVNQSGAEVILLGCAGMAPHAPLLQSDLAKRRGNSAVPVVDGVVAGIETAIGLARRGLSICKAGIYA